MLGLCDVDPESAPLDYVIAGPRAIDTEYVVSNGSPLAGSTRRSCVDGGRIDADLSGGPPMKRIVMMVGRVAALAGLPGMRPVLESQTVDTTPPAGQAAIVFMGSAASAWEANPNRPALCVGDYGKEGHLP